MVVLGKKRILLLTAGVAVALPALLFLYHYRVQAGRILRPFLIAIAVTYIIKPLVIVLEDRKIPRKYGILIVYLIFILIGAAIAVYIVPELINNTKELVNILPQLTSDYQNMFNNLLRDIRSSSWGTELKDYLAEVIIDSVSKAQEIAQKYLDKILDIIINAVSMVLDLVLAMIIAYYFVKDGEYFKRTVLSLLPKKWKNGWVKTGREINGILSRFIQGQLLTAFIIGVLETIGLLIAGVKYPLVLGLLGGTANIIPYFGPVIGAIPAVAVALIESLPKAFWTVLVFVVVQQLDNAFISPKIIEGKLGLHPVATIAAVLVGGEFFGIAGMFLAVPVTAILRVIGKGIIEAITSPP